MKSYKCIGIDLGTSNSAIASYEDEQSSILKIDQPYSQGTYQEMDKLASAIYLPPGAEPVVGHWAKEMSHKQPERSIRSAKSWLCSQQVNRQDAILPWGSDLIEEKMSPVAASTMILKKLKETFDGENVVLTVPASFDETARRLTIDAAKQAGIDDLTLLEEPLAALYSWIAQQKDSWREQVSDGDLILVCDIGGGTSDFSLVSVHDEDGELKLERISVGRHLLLGGDNMDLALAYQARWALEESGTELDDWQFTSLLHQVSDAKEKLLSEPSLASVKIGIDSRGSNLFASAITVDVMQEWVQSIVLNGFFPLCSKDESPAPSESLGLQEFGLNYESDPAISKHLAAFLRSSAKNVLNDQRLKELCGKSFAEDFITPTKVLFNGGVFNSEQLIERVSAILNNWSSEAVESLSGNSFNLAVAQGAAFYAQLKASGEGLRIRSGTSKSFYLGIESGAMAIPGFKPPSKGLCLVPQGTEEGVALRLPKKTFALKAGQKVNFKFYTSRERAGDQLGDVVSNADKNLEDSFTLSASIPQLDDNQDQSYPVYLDAELDEMGVMNLKMQHTLSDKHWDLDLDVRQHD